jgi:hypothetical protein
MESAVSRLTSRPKKKKKAAAEPQHTSSVPNWSLGLGRRWETERGELVRYYTAELVRYYTARMVSPSIMATERPVVLQAGRIAEALRANQAQKSPALAEASGAPRQLLARS